MRTPATEVTTDDVLPIDPRRELARRASGGIEIALYWNRDDGTTSIEIWQPESALTMQFAVRAEHALDAFHHPFARLDASLGEATLSVS